jgi:hypothetical protein
MPASLRGQSFANLFLILLYENWLYGMESMNVSAVVTFQPRHFRQRNSLEINAWLIAFSSCLGL